MENEDGLTTQPEPSLRDTLAQAVAEHTESATPTESTPTQTEQAGSESVVAETQEQKAGRTANRLRDEQGRLLPGKKEAAAQEKPVSPDAASSQAPATAAPIKRPSTWKPDVYPLYDKLATGQPLTADEAKVIVDQINKREADYARGVSTYKQEWDNAKPLLEAFTPYENDFQRLGVDKKTFISGVLQTSKILAEGQPHERLQAVQNILTNNRIPAQLAVQGANGQWQLLGQPQAQQMQPQQPQFDPATIERLIENKLMAKNTESEVQHFASQQDKFPHFDLVRADMARILEAGEADDLEGAYHAALELPKFAIVRQAEALQQSQQTQEQQQAARKAKVTRAKANTISVPSTTPSGVMSKGGEKSLRETIAEAAREVEGRV